MPVYVCSDLHGNYNKWCKLLKAINFSENDYMYILGDVIDRGDEPIKLLKDIQIRSNCTLLMGNHELMMINAKDTQKQNSIGNSVLWYNNGGDITDKQFNNLSVNEQKDIMSYVKNLPLICLGLKVPKICKDGHIKEINYYLSHAGYGHIYYPVKNKDKPTLYFYQDAYAEESTILWERDIPAPNEMLKCQYKNTIFIHGHTPTRKIINNGEIFPLVKNGRIKISNKHIINVDCGSYGPKKYCTVGCLRLNDYKEFYV